MTDSDDLNAVNRREWEDGWKGHERRQMKRLAALPLSEKLAWLEQAHRLVIAMAPDSFNVRRDSDTGE